MSWLIDGILLLATGLVGAYYPSILKRVWQEFRLAPRSESAWRLAGAVLLGSLNFGLMLVLVDRLPISIAFPAATGLTVALAAVVARLRFGEKLNTLRLAGTAAIIGGVAVLYGLG